MTQAEKLEALVRRAVENGWQLVGQEAADFEWHVFSSVTLSNPHGYVKTRWSEDDLRAFDVRHNYEIKWDVMQVIFNHDFARALFGEERRYCVNPDCFQENGHPDGICDVGYGFDLPAFEFHLQQAVISKDPIDYMYGVVFGDV